MNALEIGKKYVELVKAQKHGILHETLYSRDVISVEAGAPPGQSAEARGLAAIQEKGKQWMSNHEVHSSKLDGPWPNGNRFIVRFSYDVTNKPSGKRFQMEEAALFTVENDKIVREEFFYAMG